MYRDNPLLTAFQEEVFDRLRQILTILPQSTLSPASGLALAPAGQQPPSGKPRAYRWAIIPAQLTAAAIAVDVWGHSGVAVGAGEWFYYEIDDPNEFGLPSLKLLHEVVCAILRGRLTEETRYRGSHAIKSISSLDLGMASPLRIERVSLPALLLGVFGKPKTRRLTYSAWDARPGHSEGD